MQKKYKVITWFIAGTALLWYLFYLYALKMGLAHRMDAENAKFMSNIKATEKMINLYYSDYDYMPRKIDNLKGFPKDIYFCSHRKFKSKLFNLTFENFYLFPLFPVISQNEKKKIKYSYVYDKSRKCYKVTLESPFKSEPEFKSLTFEIPNIVAY